MNYDWCHMLVCFHTLNHTFPGTLASTLDQATSMSISYPVLQLGLNLHNPCSSLLATPLDLYSGPNECRLAAPKEYYHCYEIVINLRWTLGFRISLKQTLSCVQINSLYPVSKLTCYEQNKKRMNKWIPSNCLICYHVFLPY